MCVMRYFLFHVIAYKNKNSPKKMEIFFYVAFINLLRNILILRLNTALNFMFNNDATNASVPQFPEKFRTYLRFSVETVLSK